MSFYNPAIQRKAVKPHRCTYCGEGILKNEIYRYWTGVADGSWNESKLHEECFEDLCEYGEGEYTPYSNDRPCTTCKGGGTIDETKFMGCHPYARIDAPCPDCEGKGYR